MTTFLSGSNVMRAWMQTYIRVIITYRGNISLQPTTWNDSDIKYLSERIFISWLISIGRSQKGFSRKFECVSVSAKHSRIDEWGSWGKSIKWNGIRKHKRNSCGVLFIGFVNLFVLPRLHARKQTQTLMIYSIHSNIKDKDKCFTYPCETRGTFLIISKKVEALSQCHVTWLSRFVKDVTEASSRMLLFAAQSQLKAPYEVMFEALC